MTKYWIRGDGGTIINGSKYPSDTKYCRGKEYFIVQSTTDRYFNMPKRVKYPSDLLKLTGVQQKKLVIEKE